MDSLSTLLSHVLVAFIVEFDNEFEHRIPHRTTMGGGVRGPWLASMAMWSTCMRFVAEEPIGVKELGRLARTETNLHGMQRWGYITIDPAKPKLIRATAKGRQAREVWASLFAIVEQRWQDRSGADFDRLREALWPLVSQFELDLPDCLPILGFGLWSVGPERPRDSPVERDLTFSALLSRALLAFAMEFERESDLSLAICGNVVRLLDEKGLRIRDLPLLSGVSKESIAVAIGCLRKKQFAVVEPGPVIRLTPRGVKAQADYRRRIALVENSWKQRYGSETVSALYEALQPFTTEALFRGLEPYPDGWRASIRRPKVLPDFPMVLHRGGYPDGS
jgi:hypothetical protein